MDKIILKKKSTKKEKRVVVEVSAEVHNRIKELSKQTGLKSGELADMLLGKALDAVEVQ